MRPVTRRLLGEFSVEAAAAEALAASDEAARRSAAAAGGANDGNNDAGGAGDGDDDAAVDSELATAIASAPGNAGATTLYGTPGERAIWRQGQVRAPANAVLNEADFARARAELRNRALDILAVPDLSKCLAANAEALQWTEAHALVDSFDAYYSSRNAPQIALYADSMRAGIQYRMNVKLDFMT